MESLQEQHKQLLTVTDLSVSLGSIKVLDNINLNIHQQEQWAVVGHSGAGKTTLAHALIGKVFYSGHIQWNLSSRKPCSHRTAGAATSF